jgi:tryptophanyl-tRNA synthetase
MRATGSLHLGNYLGAARDFVALSKDPSMECFFGIADLHALTSLDDPKTLRPNVLGVARDYIAAGIDTENSALFLQSDIPETSELFWLLCNVSSAGKLQRSKTFKEMSEKQPENVNAGLLNYPILMAADILGPQADIVPVGDDQMAHLEMARQVARSFNSRFGEVFKMPAAYRQAGLRVPGLDGKAKMSKSLDNGFAITEEPNAMWKRLRKAAIDPARQAPDIPGDPGQCVVGQIHRMVSGETDLAWVEEGCTQAKIGCGDCKKKLHANLVEMFAPIREAAERLTDDDVLAVLKAGAERVRPRITETLEKAKKGMGL